MIQNLYKINKWYPERGTNIFENYFLNFYFLKVDISLTMQDPNLTLHIYYKHCCGGNCVSDC